jgi:hypothetical protein
VDYQSRLAIVSQLRAEIDLDFAIVKVPAEKVANINMV